MSGKILGKSGSFILKENSFYGRNWEKGYFVSIKSKFSLHLFIMFKSELYLMRGTKKWVKLTAFVRKIHTLLKVE